MKNGTKLLSFLLAFVMLCSVVPYVETKAATISLNRPLDMAYTITAREYYSNKTYHGAIDYGCPKGTPVYAAESGIITVHDGGFGDGYYGCQDGNTWGNYADISHGNGYYTRYAHMSAGRFVVASGTSVQKGQLIGYSGNSGSSTGPHLHFGLYLNGLTSAYKVYPEPYIQTATGYFEGNAPSNTPVGMVDNIRVKTRQVTVSGWVYDRDDLNRSVEVHVYIGETCIGTGVANQHRPDVNENPAHLGVGAYHGYEIECNIPAHLVGTQTILIYGIDKEATDHPRLGYSVDGTVNIPDDTDPPVISDIKIVEITGTSITVSCTVTDNTGVDCVRFPAWTEPLQDDLLSDWTVRPESLGKKNGNTYTYTIDIANHNYEKGPYVFHIYAWDKFGNYQCVAYDQQLSVVVYGDCNGDNAVNGKDVTRLLRYSAGIDPETGKSETEISHGADCTGDGAVNGKDATRLLRYLANYDPVTGESEVTLGPSK